MTQLQHAIERTARRAHGSRAHERGAVDLAGDFGPEPEQFLRDVHAGLRSVPRTLPSQYLYDARGSMLFDEICELDEYYLTRAELEILRERGHEICRMLGPDSALIELGSGSSLKTRELLAHLPSASAYVPVDISREHLRESAHALRARYPQLAILPVCADYTRPFSLPEWRIPPKRCVAYFSGSTIGNMVPEASVDMLRQLRRIAGAGGGVLIGVDLHKDRATLEAAYDDAKGVTAAFELNLLARINRELDAEFDLAAWRYEARYDEAHKRVEMFVRSEREQRVRIGDASFVFARGERVLTEVSYKFTRSGFAQMARRAGLGVVKVWTDRRGLYTLQYLEPA